MEETTRLPTSPRAPSWAPPHPREAERLASVFGLSVRDRVSDPTLDEIARLAASLFGAPHGLVTLVREGDQRYVGRHGIERGGTSREQAVCAHTILRDGPFVVPDLRRDPRFAALDAVVRQPFVRFYAGAAVRDRRGLPLGSLCALGTKPCEPHPERLDALARLAAAAGAVLEAQFLVADLALRSTDPRLVDGALLRLDRALSPLPRLLGGEAPECP